MTNDITRVGGSGDADDMPDDVSEDMAFETPAHMLADKSQAMRVETSDDMPDDMLEDADLELITDYLSHQLPPERVTEVERRLEQDEAFRKFAAPLVLAWSIAPKWKREPMPRAQLDAMWDDFTKRVGLVQQPRKPRRRWLRLVGLFFALFVFWLAAPIVLYKPGREGEAKPMQFVPVVDSGGWMTLGTARVKLDPGAKLQRARSETGTGDIDILWLEGSANFVHLMEESPEAVDPTPFTIMTDVAAVTVTNANARISARKDTTDVEVLRRVKERHAVPAGATYTDSVIAGLAEATHDLVGLGSLKPLRLIPLRKGEIGRVTRGQKPVKLRAVADTSFDDNPLVRWVLGQIKKVEEKHDSLEAALPIDRTVTKDSSRRAP